MRRPSDDPHSAHSAEARLDALTRATGQVVWHTAPDGTLLGDSPSWRAFTGQTSAELSGLGWQEAIHPDDVERFRARWTAAFAAREPLLEVEHRLRRAGGGHAPTLTRAALVQDADGRVAGFVATNVEQSTQQAVRQNEERLRLATRAAQVAVWEYDFLAGSMTRTDNHDALYGLPQQEVWTIDTFLNATHPEDRGISDRHIQASVAPGGPDEYAFDFRVIWPDGSVHWLAVTGQVSARDEKGVATLVRGVLIDVTRLKNVEAELREAIRTRDEFLQVASHELNTPLTPLALKLSSLIRRLGGTGSGPRDFASVARDLGMAHRQVKRLAELINELLDVSRLSRGSLRLSPVELDLGELVREVVDQHGLEARRTGSEVELQLSGGVVGRWDKARLEQVVSNLVTNALKYGAGKPVTLSLVRDGGWAKLTVRDQGIGIEPEALPRIFEKFERAVSARNYGGLGLGLYIVRQLVEAHGGHIRAESTPKQGSSFYVELPLEPKLP